MITEQELAQTSITTTYEISPVQNIIGDISGLLGTACGELIGSFYPNSISRKANIIVTELLNNAVANHTDGSSHVVLEVGISERALVICVKNCTTQEQFEKVRSHIDMINTSKDKRRLLGSTIREKRNGNSPGGLGLIRLAAENKCRLAVEYDAPILVVKTEFSIG